MSSGYDAIVIGSGLGGLTAGALLAKAGQKVLLIEQNNTFGGAATTYHRGAMTIEASLHETTDPRTTFDPKGDIFKALHLYEDLGFIPIDNFFEVRCPLIGAPLTIPYGFDALCDCLVERFPQDKDAIHRFIKHLDSIQHAMTMLMEKHCDLWWLAHGVELPIRLWSVLHDMRSSLSSVLDRFFGDNEAIKFALAANLIYYADDPDTMWWLAYAIPQSGFIEGAGNYIRGGSKVLSDKLIDRIHEEGGETIAEHSVVEVLLGDQREVAGVRYRPRAGGKETIARAPVVCANASPHAVEAMLPEAQRDVLMAHYRNKPLSTSLFSINLGLSQPPSTLGVSAYSTMIIPDWMRRFSDFKRCATLLKNMPGDQLPMLAVVDYSHIESGLGNDDLFPLSVVGVDRLTNWEGLSNDAYNAKKDAWLTVIVNRLDKEWPGLSGAVVQQEMATARTMFEYLNTPGGALYGFAPNVPNRLLLSGPPRSSKTSIKGLWLASAFAGFGGFSGAMGAGGAAAKAALHDTYPKIQPQWRLFVLIRK